MGATADEELALGVAVTVDALRLGLALALGLAAVDRDGLAVGEPAAWDEL
jgi:hypothetical protein